jgi:membrane protein required for beta-lactamase induction
VQSGDKMDTLAMLFWYIVDDGVIAVAYACGEILLG